MRSTLRDAGCIAVRSLGHASSGQISRLIEALFRPLGETNPRFNRASVDRESVWATQSISGPPNSEQDEERRSLPAFANQARLSVILRDSMCICDALPWYVQGIDCLCHNRMDYPCFIVNYHSGKDFSFLLARFGRNLSVVCGWSVEASIFLEVYLALTSNCNTGCPIPPFLRPVARRERPSYQSPELALKEQDTKAFSEAYKGNAPHPRSSQLPTHNLNRKARQLSHKTQPKRSV